MDPKIKNPKQVGGYATVYRTPYNFTFITVKGKSKSNFRLIFKHFPDQLTNTLGGRHEVPETAPRQALEMITRMINGDNF